MSGGHRFSDRVPTKPEERKNGTEYRFSPLP